LPHLSAFDFVRSIGDEVLIRYRNGSGDALLSFKHYKQPQLVDASAVGSSEVLETVGPSGLLLTATNVAHDPVGDPQSYQLWILQVLLVPDCLPRFLE
jgi:hypothetical protein